MNNNNFIVSELSPYVQFAYNFIPLHQWNKYTGDTARGKTPIHNDWPNRDYAEGEYKNWLEKGLNIGIRLKPNQLVIDLDPRNYDGENIEDIIADLFDYLDFDELIENLATVKTGAGYHIYCTIPDDISPRDLSETVKSLPGVEFKKKMVVSAGSKHPNGNFYRWLNEPHVDSLGCVSGGEIVDLPLSIIRVIKREPNNKSDYSLGKGALNDQQLYDLILSKLDVNNYSDNDTWFPILCAAHHITDGEGIESFLEWSLEDPDYQHQENDIRNRWESIHNNKKQLYTAGTLIHELEKTGDDTNNLKTILSFAELDLNNDDDDIDLTDSDNSNLLQERTLLEVAGKIAENISNDVEKEYPDLIIRKPGKSDGIAFKFIKDISSDPNDEEISKAIRLINSSHAIDAIKAKTLLQNKLGLPKSAINELMKKQVSNANSQLDLAKLISIKTLKQVFNRSKHIICPPNGNAYIFNKTHWIGISDNFLCRLVQFVKEKLSEKLNIKVNELHLIKDAVQLTKIKVSSMVDLLHGAEIPNPVINCKNGELWMKNDGSHELREHNYRSYLSTCLNVNYNPKAKAQLFKTTLEEIFLKFPDTDDLIRHIGELLGYAIQPNKNIASWWLFKGPGGDGKTIITKILGAILKDSQLNTTSKTLELGGSGAYNHAINSLVNKLAVVVGELPIDYKLNDAGMKLLSETGVMEANPKSEKTYNFTYAGTVIMCSNSYPKTKDVSVGNFRRANVIPFNRQFSNEGIEDINRFDKIVNDPDEMSGVLNFMLEGYQRLRDRGKFLVPKSCEEALEEWKGSSNNTFKFASECILRTNNTDIVGDLKAIFSEDYQIWCDENAISPKYRLARKQFKETLESLGFTVRVGGGNLLTIYGGKLKENKISDFDNLN